MSELLKHVEDFYLKSRDFNGYYFHREDEDERAEAADLVRSGLLQIVSEED